MTELRKLSAAVMPMYLDDQVEEVSQIHVAIIAINDESPLLNQSLTRLGKSAGRSPHHSRTTIL